MSLEQLRRYERCADQHVARHTMCAGCFGQGVCGIFHKWHERWDTRPDWINEDLLKSFIKQCNQGNNTDYTMRVFADIYLLGMGWKTFYNRMSVLRDYGLEEEPLLRMFWVTNSLPSTIKKDG